MFRFTIAVLMVLLCGYYGMSETVYPESRQESVQDTLHGVPVADPFRWLENGDSPDTRAWTAAQNRLTRKYLDQLPQRDFLRDRFESLWRYDDRTAPAHLLDSPRIFWWEKRADDEKWRLLSQAQPDSETVTLLDPNQWPEEKTIAGTSFSRNGRYLVYGVSTAGDENPKLRVLDLDSGQLLPDRVQGHYQYPEEWLPDNSGFYYTAKPLPGEVPEGEEYYWHSVWLHRLGSDPASDRKVFSHPDRKEYYHGIQLSEDSDWQLLYRWNFSRNEIYLQRPGDSEPTPLVTGFQAQFQAEVFGNRLYITTDYRAPRGEVYVADPESPAMDNWKRLIPEHPEDNLQHIQIIGGQIYATWLHHATTRIAVYNLEGAHLHDIAFPQPGTAHIHGMATHREAWINYSSYVFPPVIWRYDTQTDTRETFHEFPLQLHPERFMTRQVFLKSADGTRLHMFIIQPRDFVPGEPRPLLLTGYGGFEVPLTPYFSTTYLTWLEAGGLIAIPNLRGGGEYGKDWHEAGMRENKQRVFDDFIAAAEWLIAEHYTSASELAIDGGSNGGLLVGAVMVQRPELYRAVVCSVPLLDMIRYHHFGLANIWETEYGTSDDPQMFPHLLAYSPYHHVEAGAHYPALLLVASDHDARVDPLHARKMAAMMQTRAAADSHPCYLLIQDDSGHGGGTTLSARINQVADEFSFLMDQLGIMPREENTNQPR